MRKPKYLYQHAWRMSSCSNVQKGCHCPRKPENNVPYFLRSCHFHNVTAVVTVEPAD